MKQPSCRNGILNFDPYLRNISSLQNDGHMLNGYAIDIWSLWDHSHSRSYVFFFLAGTLNVRGPLTAMVRFIHLSFVTSSRNERHLAKIFHPY